MTRRPHVMWCLRKHVLLKEAVMSLEDFIIVVFCLIDGLLKNTACSKLRQRGFAPGLSDSEMITM